LEGVEVTAAGQGEKDMKTESLIELAKLFDLLGPAGAQSPAQANTERPVRETSEARRVGIQEAPDVKRGARKFGRKSWAGTEETKRLRAELDEIGLAFRLCKSGVNRPEGWMRAVRQAIGFPVVELARRMGVAKAQVFRLEESEQEGRVRLATLRRAAEAMGCELVYALVPREGKLASLAATQRAEDEAKREEETTRRKSRRKEEWKSSEWGRRGETIREECERLGIAAEIYGR
jgi:predicted DNA-binding mobile mystery protein A